MKGFVRVLEAIIASIILLASLSYFFIPQVRQSKWDDVVINTQALESLTALKRSGDLDIFVINNDVDGLDIALRRMIPPVVDFSVEVSGIPPPVIKIACWCTSSEADDLETRILDPTRFLYKNRQIDIRITTVSDPTGMPPETNILFVFGYENMNSFASTLDKFLESGGSIFLFGDLTSAQVNDGFLNTRFGLAWGGSGGGVGRFSDTTTPSNVSYRIAKYYQGIRNEDPASVSLTRFSGGALITVENNRSVIVNPTRTLSYVKANEFVNLKGRTVWFQNYDYAFDNPDVQAINNLTKAAILWASGERFKMDAFTKNPAPIFSEARYISILNGFEPFEIKLTYWKVFY